MKNTLIAIIVLVLIIAGAWLVLGKGQEAKAPVTLEENVLVENESEESAVKEFTITGENFKFDPSTITVQKGDLVKITFKNTQGFHDFKIDQYSVATKQANAPMEEVIEFRADKAGLFEYYCSVGEHRAMGMKGTLVVEE